MYITIPNELIWHSYDVYTTQYIFSHFFDDLSLPKLSLHNNANQHVPACCPNAHIHVHVHVHVHGVYMGFNS